MNTNRTETAMSLKQLNKKRIKAWLRGQDEGTKLSIATGTGLSVATCGNLLKELLATGEVIELPLAESTGGRPSRRFKFNADYAYIGCIYINNDHPALHIAYSVIDLLGKTIYESQHYCNDISIRALEKVTAELIESYPNVKQLCFGIPGVVSSGNILSCDYSELERFDLCGYFTEKYHLEVFVENDINATASGYYDIRGTEDDESLAYLFYPGDYCPGAGFIVQGMILRGFSNFAGEVGNMVLSDKSVDRNITPPVKNDDDLIISAARTIANINTVLNPRYLVLAGRKMDDLTFEMIRSELLQYIPEEHIPELIYEEDIHRSYVHGLSLMAMEQ